MPARQIDRMIGRLAYQILESEDSQGGMVLIGIRRGGEIFARRLAAKMEEIDGVKPALGFLNINLYRDDDVAHALPDSEIHEDLAGKTAVIVDDVLFTGRTVRSALDAITDLGRPRVIRLAALIDRGSRELPVAADYVGRFIPAGRDERIEVVLHKSHSEDDRVSISRNEHAAKP